MNIKRNIIFSLESRKKNGIVVAENIPVRMRVVYAGMWVEFSTGYRIDAAKWDNGKQRVRNGCTNSRPLPKSTPTCCSIIPTCKRYSNNLR